jgi:hypothetical protein
MAENALTHYSQLLRKTWRFEMRWGKPKCATGCPFNFPKRPGENRAAVDPIFSKIDYIDYM